MLLAGVSALLGSEPQVIPQYGLAAAEAGLITTSGTNTARIRTRNRVRVRFMAGLLARCGASVALQS
jgi:hypothetical protein